jgi:hypothetical protein
MLVPEHEIQTFQVAYKAHIVVEERISPIFKNRKIEIGLQLHFV